MKVFVSSTSEDLTEYRAAAIRGLRRLGHDVVAMEDMTAARTYPLDRVLEAVRDSDAVVIIVAWRYGYVPVGAANAPLPPGAVADHTSITEFEYLAAIDKDIPILPFLLDESAPWPPRHIDGFTDPTVSLADVTAFRSRLMQDHVVSFFSGPDQLESLVTAAVSNTRIAGHVTRNVVDLGVPVTADQIIPDSSYAGGIIQVVSDARTERVVTIDIASEWWSTRLYLLAFMLSRLTGARRLLILDGGRFVGMLSLNTVLRVFAGLHPELIRFDRSHSKRSRVESDINAEAGAIVALFERSFSARPEWDTKLVLSEANLRFWFDEALNTSPIRINDLSRPSAFDLVRLLEYPGGFVPVLSEGGDGVPPIIHVVDAEALSAQLARSYVAELLDAVGIG